MADSTSSSRRARLRFGLRGMLIAVTCLCLVIGYFAREYVRQRQAIQATEALGGRVHFDDGDPRHSFAPQGVDALTNAVTGRTKPIWLELSGKKVSDGAVEECILPLDSLKLVSLSDVEISNEALPRLAALAELTHLYCTRDARHEKVLNELDSSTRLEFTDLPIDAAFEYLADFHDVPFQFDKPAFESASIGLKHPLTYKTPPQIRLEDALTATLTPHGLGWHITEGMIVITSKQVAQKKREHVERLRRAMPNLKSLQVD